MVSDPSLLAGLGGDSDTAPFVSGWDGFVSDLMGLEKMFLLPSEPKACPSSTLKS